MRDALGLLDTDSDRLGLGDLYAQSFDGFTVRRLVRQMPTGGSCDVDRLAGVLRMELTERDRQIREAMERHWETSKCVMSHHRPAKWHCIKPNGDFAAGCALYSAPMINAEPHRVEL